jgi:hypothetical protein
MLSIQVLKKDRTRRVIQRVVVQLLLGLGTFTNLGLPT